MSALLRFCCPRCRGPLRAEAEAYHCRACPRAYPIVLGIPDFRLEPDPRLPVEEDYRRARRLEAEAPRRSFEDLLLLYWEMSPDTPAAAKPGYIRFALDAKERAGAALAAVDARAGRRWEGTTCLELGCGTGGFLAAARDRFDTVVGIDVGLRWLVVTRRRLGPLGDQVRLVCAAAESLPFPDDAFDGAVTLHMLEHATDAGAAFAEAARVLRPGGLCYAVTPNRLSLGPEPCVRVWGVGFLPRAWAPRYVELVAGRPYRHIRLLSSRELARLTRRAGLRDVMVGAPRITSGEARTLPRGGRALVALYHAARCVPGTAGLVRQVGPLLELIARK